MPLTPARSDAPDPKEFVRLLSAHERRLNSYILSLVPNWADAEDLAQETKIRLWEQFGEYDPAKDFGAWARAILYYQVLTYRKQSARQHARLSEASLEAIAAEVPASTELVDAQHHALEGCLKELPDENRDLLSRVYSGKETMREMSKRLGRSYDALRKSILRTRTALADCVERTIHKQGSEP